MIPFFLCVLLQNWLLQGSTSVYSRKVEHVYQLVQSTIDFLTQQKQQKNANANASKSKNGDDDMAGDEVGRSSEPFTLHFGAIQLVQETVCMRGCDDKACLEVQQEKQAALNKSTPALGFIRVRGLFLVASPFQEKRRKLFFPFPYGMRCTIRANLCPPSLSQHVLTRNTRTLVGFDAPPFSLKYLCIRLYYNLCTLS